MGLYLNQNKSRHYHLDNIKSNFVYDDIFFSDCIFLVDNKLKKQFTGGHCPCDISWGSLTNTKSLCNMTEAFALLGSKMEILNKPAISISRH